MAKFIAKDDSRFTMSKGIMATEVSERVMNGEKVEVPIEDVGLVLLIMYMDHTNVDVRVTTKTDVCYIQLVDNLLEKIEDLRHLVWGKDIASPTCPEYREHHEDIQAILKFIDVELIGANKQ